MTSGFQFSHSCSWFIMGHMGGKVCGRNISTYTHSCSFHNSSKMRVCRVGNTAGSRSHERSFALSHPCDWCACWRDESLGFDFVFLGWRTGNVYTHPHMPYAWAEGNILLLDYCAGYTNKTASEELVEGKVNMVGVSASGWKQSLKPKVRNRVPGREKMI